MTAEQPRVAVGPVEEATGYPLRRIVLYGTLTALVGFYLAPLEAGFMVSFKDVQAAARTLPFAPPTPGQFTVDPWVTAVAELQQGLVGSFLLAIPATVVSAALGSLAAYGLTNVDWDGQVAVYLLFLAGIFIPYQAVLVPLSRFWSAYVGVGEALAPLGLSFYGTIFELVVTHVAYGIPICTLLFRSHYKNLSEEMLEAAQLDGAGVYRRYRAVVLPLSIPMFAVTLIYQFTQIWNDLLFALIITPSGSGTVVTMALTGLGGGMVQTFNLQMAGAFVAALPTLVVYVFFGDKFAKGVSAG